MKYYPIYSDTNVAANCRRLRREAGLTLNDLAALTGFSVAKISRIEHAQTQPRRGTLETFARVFGVTEESLFLPPADDDVVQVSAINNDVGNDDRKIKRLLYFTRSLNNAGWRTLLTVAEALSDCDRTSLIPGLPDEEGAL